MGNEGTSARAEGPRTRAVDRRAAIALPLSLLAHALLALAISHAPPFELQRLTVPEATEIELVIDAPSVAEEHDLVTPPPPDERSAPRPVRRARPARTPVTATIDPSPATPVSIVDVAPTESEAAPIDHVETPSLDPRLVAARLTVGPGPSQEGPPATLDDSAAHAPTPLGEALASVQASLVSATGGHEAFSERPYRVVQRPDGAYHYEGVGFEGVIEADGSIRMEDRPPIGFDPATGSVTFDLTDMIMRSAGQDPYVSERLGFLDATEELRGRLEDEARAAGRARELRRLRGRLARIWQDETRTAADRRRAIFEHWDEADDGSEGDEARAIVLAFIREEQAFSADIAYGEAELARLNASRLSIARFAP